MFQITMIDRDGIREIIAWIADIMILIGVVLMIAAIVIHLKNML